MSMGAIIKLQTLWGMKILIWGEGGGH